MVVNEIQFQLTTKKFKPKATRINPIEGEENDQRIIVDQSVDWLYNKMYLLLVEKRGSGEKEYGIASCDIGKIMQHFINCYISFII